MGKTLEHYFVRALVHRWRQNLTPGDQREYAFFLMKVVEDALERFDAEQAKAKAKER